MKGSSILVLAVCFVISGCTMNYGPTSTTPTLLNAGRIQFADVSEVPGLRAAAVWGDPAKGPHANITRWQPGTTVPMHSHPSGFRAFVQHGTFIWRPETGEAMEIGPGSWAYMPAGVRHTTTCKAGGDECVVYTEVSGKTGTIPAEDS